MNGSLRNKRVLTPTRSVLSGQASVGRARHRVLQFQLLAAAVIWLLAAPRGYADKVVLVGGDVIEGTMTRQTDSIVVLEHGDLGRVEIPRSHVESVQIDVPEVAVVLTDGETIRGKMVEEDDSFIVLEHKDLGPIKIPKDHVASTEVGLGEAKIVLAGGDTVEGTLLERTKYAVVIKHPTLGRLEIPRVRIDSLEIQASGARKEQKSGLLDAQVRELAAWSSRQKEKGWKYSVDLSLDTSSGATNEQVSRLASDMGRERPDTKAEFDVSYYRKVSDDELTDHKVTLGYMHDWLDPESVWFWFALARYDYDEFESWKQRANAQTGPGYHLIKSDDWMLDLRLGLGARREWGSENDNGKAEGLVGADFRWKITDSQTCAFAPYFFPVVGDLDDYRARITGEWSFLFSKDMLLSFLVGTLYEYQSIVDPGNTHGDLRVYLGLRYGF